MKKIKYIAFYSDTENIDNRNYALSAKNKIDYIISVLNQSDYSCDTISPSWTRNLSGFYKGSKIINNMNTFKYFTTFGSKIKIIRYIKYKWSMLQLWFYLLFTTKKNESVIVYHSADLSSVLLSIVKLKKIKLILEVEEIYKDLIILSRRKIKLEKKLIEKASAYIFSTHLLGVRVNKSNKPMTILHGKYSVEEQRVDKFEDDKIHLVYSGTLQIGKGATLAVRLAKYLNEKYVIHILGIGTPDEITKIRDMIDTINKTSKAKVIYEGVLKGDDYIDFLQKCDIGLSPQMPDTSYKDTSFPSKILSYLSNGLRVVSIDIESISKSEVKDLIVFYKDDNVEELASSVKKININEPNYSREFISKLHLKFIEQLKNMLNDINTNQ